MERRDPEPWYPDRKWADPFIATLALFIILVVGVVTGRRRAAPPRPSTRVELAGRIADIALAAPRILGPAAAEALGSRDTLASFEQRTGKVWDRAILAVHAGEKGDLALGARLAQEAPGDFHGLWAWAFEGAGSAPTPGELAATRRAMGDGYAAGILAARCAARAGGDPRPLEAQAEAWALPRLAALVAAGLASVILVLGGLAFSAFLSLAPARPHPLPRYAMSGRAVLIVLLGWFITHLGAGYATGIALALLPFLRPVALPLTYLFHAVLGTAYLCRAEGIGVRELAARLLPGRAGRALVSGLGFFALAFTAVVAVTLALSPFLRAAEPPQKDLMELLSHLRGPVTVGCLFLTVAVVAPVFEELLFRGFMLPWLGERLEAKLGRGPGWILAVAVSGLTFGAMHMQPLGMPTLGTLGIVLGFAFLRTGNLLTAVLVHGLWNGAIFIFMRLLA